MYVPLGINCWCVRVIEKPVLGIMSLVLMGLNRKIFLFAQQIKNSLTTCCQLDMSQSAFIKRTSCVCTFLRNNVLPICPLLVLEEHGEAACGGILQSQNYSLGITTLKGIQYCQWVVKLTGGLITYYIILI